MPDKILEKLFEYIFSFGPAAVFFVVAFNECRLYLDPNEDGDLWKAFGFAVGGAAWGFLVKTLKEFWDEVWQSQRSSLAGSLVKQIEAFNQRVRWKLSRFDRNYLECQGYECYDYRVEGYQPFGIKMLMLEEVFVPLELGGQQADDLGRRMVLQHQRKTKQPQGELEQLSLFEDENHWKIWDFLAQTKDSPTYRRMAILASVGYGKTTLLKHIALSYAKQFPVVEEYNAPKLIPILIYLRDLRKMFNDDKENFPSLPELIHTHHISRLPAPEKGELSPPENWATDLLQKGKALVMFDGFDEVAEARRGAVSEWISEETSRYPRSVFILTSRPPGYEKYFTAEKFETTLYVRAFNNEKRQEFVHKWYACQERYERGGRDTPDVQQTAKNRANSLLQQLERRPKLSAMADNPLLLNMIATFHRSHSSDDLPKYRADLYAEICKLQLFDRPNAKGISMLLSLEQNFKLLQLIALSQTDAPSGRMTSVDKAVLEAWIRQPLLLMNDEVKPTQWIEQIAEVSELLVEKENGVYEFAHLSFQEFLAAAQIKATHQESILLDHFEESEWREAILLYAAQSDPAQLVQEACRRNKRDALQLGYDCVRESAKKIEPDVFEQLQKLRYQPLETYLSQGEWEKANRETLKMMLRTVGKREDQYLEPQELLTFPCDDLLRIDGLWVKHSEGKFGFSVQKEIYLECGGVPDGEYYKEAFEKFGERVRWIEDGTWKLNVAFDTSAPLGHLPCVVWVGGGELVVAVTLTSRIQTCKL